MVPKFLTKSRFKLAVECPTKLAYTSNRAYANTKKDDQFLLALAKGGFQIGEMAKMLYPTGIEVLEESHAAQLQKTSELMAAKDSVIFEGAIAHGDLFARVDILNKVGNRIDLIEVKAITFDGNNPYDDFEGARSPIKAKRLAYLQDIAFQKYLLSKAYPELIITSYLMMIDKTKTCSVSGLNQKFKIRKVGNHGQFHVEVDPGLNLETMGSSILGMVNVDKYVQYILETPLKAPGVEGFFESVVLDWANKYATSQRISPVIGSHCGKCEFRAVGSQSQLLDGFKQCWHEVFGWRESDFLEDTVLDLYRAHPSIKKRLFDERKLKLSDLIEGDLEIKLGDEGLTQTQRQEMQVFGRFSQTIPFYIDRDSIRSEMKTWSYPYYFIDFETCGVAVPFFAGKTAYAPVAFQFSVHTIDADGVLRHADEFLETTPGKNPTYEFIRALKKALGKAGTVFMWSPYENSVLNAIYKDMGEDVFKGIAPPDVEELQEFINTLVVRKDSHIGRRAMVDLCKIAEKYFFHPSTKGRSSIKVVLPAVLQSSELLKERYSQPIYGAAGHLVSKNFQDWAWWRAEGGQVCNPYTLLPPIFDDLSTSLLEEVEDEDGVDFEINEGGAASMAYSRLQFENLSEEYRDRIRRGLLKYCELDTLAMAMVFEAWQDWVGD